MGNEGSLRKPWYAENWQTRRAGRRKEPRWGRVEESL